MEPRKRRLLLHPSGTVERVCDLTFSDDKDESNVLRETGVTHDSEFGRSFRGHFVLAVDLVISIPAADFVDTGYYGFDRSE